MFIPGKAVWGKNTWVGLLTVGICQNCLKRVILKKKVGAHLPLLKEKSHFHIFLRKFLLLWLCHLKFGVLVLTLEGLPWISSMLLVQLDVFPPASMAGGGCRPCPSWWSSLQEGKCCRGSLQGPWPGWGLEERL